MGDTTEWIRKKTKKRYPERQGRLKKEGLEKKKPDDISIILQVDEGPAKRHKTEKIFKLKSQNTVPKLRLAKRGGGRAYGKNS